ncbi:MAG: hypothetical protein H7Z77_06120 [Chitinophagaceae bacterium]|nr:hypothetical protein [Polaromonas sp.]
MNRRFSTIKWAVVVSLALHAAVGWWALHGDRQNRRILPPAAGEQRLQVVLIPVERSPSLSPAVAPTAAPTAASARPRSEQPIKRDTLLKQNQASNSQTPWIDARTPEATPKTASETTPETASASAAVPVPAPKLDLNLNLSRAAQAADRLRRQSPLAAAVDSQQVQAAPSSVARAFSGLNPVASGIESETTLAGGARLVRFSGGGCMRIPNPSAKEHDDTHKPVVQSC